VFLFEMHLVVVGLTGLVWCVPVYSLQVGVAASYYWHIVVNARLNIKVGDELSVLAFFD
jgi:hypothetical protein